MNSSPPFAPPYYTTTGTEGGQQIIETLDDGSTRIVPASERTVTVIPDWSAGKPPGDKAVPGKAKTTRAAGGKDAAVFLEVPFADKDKAKKIGARWDAARKKWYVPHGTDIQLFKPWWPAGMGE